LRPYTTLQVSSNLLIQGSMVLNHPLCGAGSTGIFRNLQVDAGGIVTNAAYSTIYIANNLAMNSTNFIRNNFEGRWVFNGDLGGGLLKTQLVEVASLRKSDDVMAQTNFMFGTFQIGDPITGSNAWVQLVNNNTNQSAGTNQIFAASNLIVNATSALDLNSRSGFFFSVRNLGTILQTNLASAAVSTTRVDIVNSFTNEGRILIGNGSFLQFSNAFLNGVTGIINITNNAVLTNFLVGSVLTNQGEIIGGGTMNNGSRVMPTIGNEGIITATNGTVAPTNGTLVLAGGFTNGTVGGDGPVNVGLLRALGAGAQLLIPQGFTNRGTIAVSNGTFTTMIPLLSPGLPVRNEGLIRGFGSVNSEIANSGLVSNDTTGTLIFGLNFSNAVGGTVASDGGGNILFSNGVHNLGTIRAAFGSQLTFNQTVTNDVGAGIHVHNQSLATFNGGLTNLGTLSLDPSTAIINGTLTLGASGIITMGNSSNDVLILRGDFHNASTNNTQYYTRHGTIVFGSAAAGVSNVFEIAGVNKLDTFAGFETNFAVGTLQITNHIVFTNAVDNGGGLGTNEALYVDVLHLFAGATLKLSQLTIYVGQMFMEDNSGQTITSGIINEFNIGTFGLLNVFLSDGGQIVLVPEPSTAVLMGAGLLALIGGRRRRGRTPAKD
jgi:hypothetical protein